MLSQSYDPMWKAYEVTECKLGFLCTWLPYVFGKEIQEHVLVNNWANGWKIDSDNSNTWTPDQVRGDTKNVQDDPTSPRLRGARQNEMPQRTIVLFFLPQLLQWIGLLVLPIPFLLLLRKKIGH